MSKVSFNNKCAFSNKMVAKDNDRTWTNQKSLITSSNTKRKRHRSLSATLLLYTFGVFYSLLIIPSVYGECPVLEKVRCDFEYVWKDPNNQIPDEPVTKCVQQLPNKGYRTGYYIPENTGQCGEGGCSPAPIEHYCPLIKTSESYSKNTALIFDDQRAWGVCNGGCFDDEDEPIDWEGNSVAALLTCKINVPSCVFPFKYKGKTHNSCIKSGEDYWCATKVHKGNNGTAVDGFWGQCDVKAGKTDCDPEYVDPIVPEAWAESIVAKVEINETEFDSGVSASIDFVDNGLELKITGWVKGLVPGYRGFHIHENPFENGDCMTAGSHFNPLNKVHGRQGQDSHIGDLGNLRAGDTGEAKIDITIKHPKRATLDKTSELTILGRTLVIHKDKDNLKSKKDGGDGVGNAGARLACGIIQEQSEEADAIMYYIIVAVIIIILVLLLLICLIWRCCKRSDKGKTPIGNGIPNGKLLEAFGDDISCPFIDATPAASPKPGRSTDRLSFFNRSISALAGSRGSLSNTPDKC